MTERPPRPIKSVEDLDVFEKAYQAALDIHRLSLEFPAIEQRALADQMRRASKSVCANLAEGFGRQRASTPDFKRFLSMAIGSSDEMKVWLRFAADLGYLDAAAAEALRERYTVIARMLTGLSERWR